MAIENDQEYKEDFGLRQSNGDILFCLLDSNEKQPFLDILLNSGLLYVHSQLMVTADKKTLYVIGSRNTPLFTLPPAQDLGGEDGMDTGTVPAQWKI